ncbi:MAG: hypothetical protein HPY53_01455 [Brevinematales bacterium]|nr:hypothetical protein [Brevinematales bacterium]
MKQMKYMNEPRTPTLRALEIIKEWPGISAMNFAGKMWPDSPKWKKMYEGGNGSTMGRGMWLSAGSFLSRLQKKGFIQCSHPLRREPKLWKISEKGIEYLECNIW